MECFQRGELQRLNADVDTILVCKKSINVVIRMKFLFGLFETGPVIKKFYTQFLEQPTQQHAKTSPRIHIRLLEESLLQTDEQT